MARAVLVFAALTAIAASACGKSSSKDDDSLPPNAGIIPPAVPASGPQFADHQQRYTINAPGVWEVNLVGNPPNLLMQNPEDRSVQIVVDFGAGIDLEQAKSLANNGVTRPGIALSPIGEGQWWRRDGIEGWGMWLDGTSSGQPIEGYTVWLVGPPGALAIVGAGPPAKKNAVRQLVESVANSAVFPDAKGAPPDTGQPGGLVGQWLHENVSSSGKLAVRKALHLCADGRFFDTSYDKMNESDEPAGTWTATGGGKKGTLTLAYAGGKTQNEPYEARGATLTVNELAFERDGASPRCR